MPGPERVGQFYLLMKAPKMAKAANGTTVNSRKIPIRKPDTCCGHAGAACRGCFRVTPRAVSYIKRLAQ